MTSDVGNDEHKVAELLSNIAGVGVRYCVFKLSNLFLQFCKYWR
jgi:hypothetical protein